MTDRMVAPLTLDIAPKEQDGHGQRLRDARFVPRPVESLARGEPSLITRLTCNKVSAFR